MKKITALLLVAVMLIFALASCGKSYVNVSNIKTEDYIELGDYKKFTYDEIKAAYDALCLENSKAYRQFNLDWGYKFEFNIVTEIKQVDGDKVTYTKVPEMCYEGDNTRTIEIFEDSVNQYRMKFDNALVYNRKTAESKSSDLRTVTIGVAFDFEYVAPYYPQNSEVSGKTLRMTVTPVSVIPTPYNDDNIVETIGKFLDSTNDASTRKILSIGDVVTADIDGTVDGERLDGLKYSSRVFVLGYSGYPAEFDKQLEGVYVGRKLNFDVTFPSDWTNEELAGKTVNFTVRVISSVNYDLAVSENSTFADFADLKNAAKVQFFTERYMMQAVYERTELKSAPKNLYNEYYSFFKAQSEKQIKAFIDSAAQSGSTKTRDDAISINWGSASAYEKSLENSANDAVRRTLACLAVAKATGYEYTDEDYKKDLESETKYYNAVNETNLTTSEFEEMNDRNILKTDFLETHLSKYIAYKLDWMPIVKVTK
ncbi:MAG: hypothetical protein IJQ37_03015 [Clostridia bacterium]|nr:hypothetical protein [Clostridia bacterium]